MNARETGQKSCSWEMGGSRWETKAWEGCLGCRTPAHAPDTVQRRTRRCYRERPWAAGPGECGCCCQPGLSAHLHLIVAVAWLLHAVALRQLLVELGACHPAVWRPPCSQRHTAGCSGDESRVSPPELQEDQTCRDPRGGRGQRRALPKLTISQSRTPNDHLKERDPRL